MSSLVVAVEAEALSSLVSPMSGQVVVVDALSIISSMVVALEALSRLVCLMSSLVVALSIISTLVQVDAVSGGSIQRIQPVRWMQCQAHPSYHPARWRLWMHYPSNHLHNLHVKYCLIRRVWFILKHMMLLFNNV